MPARLLLAAVVLLAASDSLAASAHGFTIVTRTDAMRAGVQEAYIQPFVAATDLSAVQDTWDGGIDALRARAKAPEPGWDLVETDPEELATGCGEGLFEKIDWSSVGGKDHYLPQGVSDCGVGAMIMGTVLAWDRDKFPVTPSWADFWDVAKYPGKRGLRNGVRGNLEFALLADGVAAGDVYKTLSTSDGVDRAFRKLDQLKPYIVWWQQEADAARILGSGDVLMTSAPSARIATASRVDHRNFGVQWNTALYEVLSWAILKGSPNLRQAQQFLYFAGTPAIEARMLRISGDAGLAKGMNEGLAPELLALSASNPANMATSLRIDAAFWRDNLAKLKPRFDAWQSGH
jgi:putative spermidine/putrescine transport system substrate-binding protein